MGFFLGPGFWGSKEFKNAKGKISPKPVWIPLNFGGLNSMFLTLRVGV